MEDHLQAAIDKTIGHLMAIKLVAKLLRSDAELDEVDRDSLARTLENESSAIFDCLCEWESSSPA